MQAPWKEELALLLGIALAAVLAGNLTGWTWSCLLAGLLCYLGWHLFQLQRLPQLLAGDRSAGPLPYGLWRNPGNAIQSSLAEHGRRSRELEALAAGFRSTINALPDAVITLDPADRITGSNPAAASLLAVAWPAASGKPLTSMVSDPLVREYMARADFT
ncbi:MAG TPA: phosphate regulon sensor protein PhoR, partial [Gammaproteobacteria bacterium]|nr:phosphate regulon sensor protein PhoR [Gammaproteobacteria bacterium]